MDALARIEALTKLVNDKDRDLNLQGEEINMLLRSNKEAEHEIDLKKGDIYCMK